MMNHPIPAAEAGHRAGPPHPITRESPHADLVPVPASIREALTIGADPDTGEPLQLSLWNPRDGAKVVMIDVTDGHLASDLASSIAERVTACDDAALLHVHWLSPMDGFPRAAYAEAPASDAGRVLMLLQFAHLVIAGRHAAGRGIVTHTPAGDAPLWVLLIEDAARVADDPEAWAVLQGICARCRPEGVAVVIATDVPSAHAGIRADVTLGGDVAGRVFHWDRGDASCIAAGRAGRSAGRPLEPALESLQPLLDLAAGDRELRGSTYSWDGEDDDPATPDDRAAARPAGVAFAPAGSWYAAQADRAALEVEEILGRRPRREGTRVTGHGLMAVTYALLSVQEAITAAGSDVCDAIADAGEALADLEAAAGEIAAAIDTPAPPPARRRARRGPLPRPGIEYTAPEVLTEGVEAGWADAEEDPAAIDWAPRRRQALIPFTVTGGRPVSPWAPTGIRRGRNKLGLWAENPMADAIVTCRHHGVRHLLMVERDDGHGWAVPGGSIEWAADGTPAAAAVRELVEETGLKVGEDLARQGAPRHVPDPRASDEAWAVTVPCGIDLGDVAELPGVKGGDDARRAEWIEALDYDDLTESLRFWHSGSVFTAHQAMLRAFLGGLPAVGAGGAAAPAVRHRATRRRTWLRLPGITRHRALCGEDMRPLPGQPQPGPGSPDCPACTAIHATGGRR